MLFNLKCSIKRANAPKFNIWNILMHENHNKYYFYNCHNLFNTSTDENLDKKISTFKDIDWLDCDLRNELARKRRHSCRLSRQNLLLHIYNNFTSDLIIKLTNKIIAPYQALSKPVSKTRKATYLYRFSKILNEKLQSKNTEMNNITHIKDNSIYLSKMYLNCMDILVSQDMLNMLTTRSVLKHGFDKQKNSNFECFISNFKKHTQASESPATTSFHKKDLIIRKTVTSEPIRPKIYESKVRCQGIFENINADNMAFILNLPYIKEPQLSNTLYKTISHFGTITSLQIFSDRLSPFEGAADLNHKGKLPPGKEHSQLYGLVQFETNEAKLRFCDIAIRGFGTLYNGRLIYSEYAERKNTLTLVMLPPFESLQDAFEEIANGLTYSSDQKSENLKERAFCEVFCAEEDITATSSVKRRAQKQRSKGSISELQPQCILLKFPSFQLAYIAKMRLEKHLSLQWPSFISFDTHRCTLHKGRWIDGPRVIHSGIKQAQNF